jgi:Rieske Fe-S protein
MPDDKYPPESGRRRFVKGVVGGASLSALGASGSTALNSVTNPTGEGGGQTNIMAIQNTDGPAPRGMPMIPVEIDEEGYVMGRFPTWETVEQEDGTMLDVAETEIAGHTYSARWFQYCGMEEAPGVQPENADSQDQYFRYTTPPPAYDWQQTEVEDGQRVHIDHFEDYVEWGNGIGESGLGKPAKGTWRSQDVERGEGQIVIQVLRIPPDRLERMKAESQFSDWIEAASTEGFIAWMDKCTHFCCVPTFKGIEQSTRFDAEDKVYCACHQSVYDPYSVVQRAFTARPRPG